ncbi:MAG TPA: hypothetical protein VFZ38_02965 [Vicinamibacterales bacterium]
MNSIRKVALACVASAVLALPLTAAAQGPANQDTFFTFSQAVELPGKTLPAGTYFFQLADSPSNRHIVKVMSKDRKEIHATLLAIPFYTNERPSDEPQVRFMETPAQASGGAATNAIKIWFYPGNSTGHEFIYPRSQAQRIAARTGQPVLTTKTEEEIAEASVTDSDLTRIDRGGADTTVDTSNRSSATTTTETQTASAQTQPAPVTSPETDRTAATTSQPDRTARTMPDRTADRDDNARTDLPNTAGMLPLLALIGIGSLVGSRMLRRSRRVQ